MATSRNYSKARKIVAYREAINGGVSLNVTTGQQELRLFYQKVRESDMEIAGDCLFLFTSTKNSQPSKTVTKPVASREVIPGTWRHHRCGWDNDNGFYQILVLLYSVANIAGLQAREYMELDDEQILNLFGFQEGRGFDYVIQFSGLDPASKTVCKAFSDAALVSAFATSYSLAGDVQTILFSNEKWRGEADGSCSFTIAFRKTTWPADWEDARDMSLRSGEGLNRAKTLTATGLDKEQAEADYDDMAPEEGETFSTGTDYKIGEMTKYDAGEGDGVEDYIFARNHDAGAWDDDDVIKGRWKLTEKRVAESGDGQYMLTGTEQAEYDGTAAADATITDVAEGVGRSQPRAARVWFRRSLAAKDILIGEDGAAVSNFTVTYDGAESSSFTHADFRIQDNGDGTFTVYQTGVKPRSWYIALDHDDDEEWLSDKFQKSVRTSLAPGKYEPLIIEVWNVIKTSYAAAWTWAKDTDSGEPGPVMTLLDEHGVSSSTAKVKYIGNDRWQAQKWVKVIPVVPDP